MVFFLLKQDDNWKCSTSVISELTLGVSDFCSEAVTDLEQMYLLNVWAIILGLIMCVSLPTYRKPMQYKSTRRHFIHLPHPLYNNVAYV